MRFVAKVNLDLKLESALRQRKQMNRSDLMIGKEI